MESRQQDVMLGATGLYMAAARAEESRRSDALFVDPFAAEFAGKEGRMFLEAISSATDMPISALCGAVAARTKYFDDALVAACRTADQVVVLAAGGDTRNIRLQPSLPPTTRFFAVDLPCVIEWRARVMPQQKTTLNIACDLVNSLTSLQLALTTAGFDVTRPTAWLLEGLVMYLTEAQVHNLLDYISSLSAPRSVVLADVLSTSYLAPQYTAKLYDEWAKHGAVPVWGCDVPERVLARHGFTQCIVDELGGEHCNFGRIPVYPAVPRVMDGTVDPMPRNLMVVATMPELPEGVAIRAVAGVDELPSCIQLAVREKWATGPAIWTPAVDLDRAGCLVATNNGTEIIGTTFAHSYSESAWLLMVLVDDRHRRKGIASKLVVAVINHLRRNRGVKFVGLDASIPGRPVYESLGFRRVDTLFSFEQLEPSLTKTPAMESFAAMVTSLVPDEETTRQVIELDETTFGFRREALMKHLICSGVSSLALGVVDGTTKKLRGFVVARKTVEGGLRAGPLIADNKECASALLGALVRSAVSAKAPFIRVWLLQNACNHVEAEKLVIEHGFDHHPEHDCTRMWLTPTLEDTLPSQSNRATLWTTGTPDIG